MISLKQSDQGMDAYKPNEYGYGTCIYLTEDQVEALGISKLKAGDKVTVKAVAFISNSSQATDMDKDGDNIDVTLSLQLTDMEVTPLGNAASAEQLYE